MCVTSREMDLIGSIDNKYFISFPSANIYIWNVESKTYSTLA